MQTLCNCLAIAAAICLRAPAQISIEDSTILSGAKITANDVELFSMTASDYLEADKRQMHRLCSDGTCIYYHKHCENAGEKVTCTFYYATSASDLLRKIDVAGKGENSVLAFLSRTALMMDEKRCVEFSRMTINDGSDTPALYSHR